MLRYCAKIRSSRIKYFINIIFLSMEKFIYKTMYIYTYQSTTYVPNMRNFYQFNDIISEVGTHSRQV